MRDRRICAIGGAAALVSLALVAFPLIGKDGHAHHAGGAAGAAGPRGHEHRQGWIPRTSPDLVDPG